MRDHRKLRAFELADAVAICVYRATQAMPKAEQFGLSLQMRRAAVSTASNIVEGCARESEADYLHFLTMAYGSAKELEYQVSLARRLGYLREDGEASLDQRCNECCRVLGSLIVALRRNKPPPGRRT